MDAEMSRPRGFLREMEDLGVPKGEEEAVVEEDEENEERDGVGLDRLEDRGMDSGESDMVATSPRRHVASDGDKGDRCPVGSSDCTDYVSRRHTGRVTLVNKGDWI
jgi:hypothetical protein